MFRKKYIDKKNNINFINNENNTDNNTDYIPIISIRFLIYST